MTSIIIMAVPQRNVALACLDSTKQSIKRPYHSYSLVKIVFLFTKNNSTESGETAYLDAGQYRHRSPDAGTQDSPGHRVDPGGGATRGAHLGSEWSRLN